MGGGGQPLYPPSPKINPRATNPEQTPRCSTPTLQTDSAVCHERFETKTLRFIVTGSGRCRGGLNQTGPPVLAVAFQYKRVLQFCSLWCFSATSMLDRGSDLGGHFRRSSTSRRDRADSAELRQRRACRHRLGGADALTSAEIIFSSLSNSSQGYKLIVQIENSNATFCRCR